MQLTRFKNLPYIENQYNIQKMAKLKVLGNIFEKFIKISR